MHEGSSRWKAAALVLIGLETAAIFWAYYALNLGGWVRRLGSDGALLGLLSQIAAVARAFFPRAVVSAVGSFVASSGVSVPLQTFVVRSTALGSGLGASSLASAVVAPAYYAARRLLRHAPSRGRSRHVGPRPAADRESGVRRQRSSVEPSRVQRAGLRARSSAS